MKAFIKYNDTEIMKFEIIDSVLNINTEKRHNIKMTQDEAFKCGKLIGMMNYGLRYLEKPILIAVLRNLPKLVNPISDKLSVEFDEELKMKI